MLELFKTREENWGMAHEANEMIYVDVFKQSLILIW